MVELKEDADDPSKVDNQKKAANYLASYLNKNQAGFSPESLSRMSGPQREHFLTLRQTAIALQIDKAFLFNRISTLQSAIFKLKHDPLWGQIPVEADFGNEYPMSDSMRKAREFYSSPADEFEYIGDLPDFGVPANSPVELAPSTIQPESEHILRFYENALIEMKKEPITLSGLADDLFFQMLELNLTSQEIVDVLKNDGDRTEAISLRGIKIRLNRLSSSAGHTGTVSVVSNWPSSISSIRSEMKAFAAPENEADPERDLWVYELDLEAMEDERQKRSPQYSWSD